MTLPQEMRAMLDRENLRDYCLSAQHPEGRHKARVFLATLGVGATDAEVLREMLLLAAGRSGEVTMVSADQYGTRYALDSLVAFGSRSAVVRSAWMVKTGEDFPRLISCYVLRGVA